MYVYSITSPYRHLSIMDSSFGPRNAKNHTSLPVYNMDTSVKWTLGSVPLVSVLKRCDCMPLGWITKSMHCFACWGGSMSLYVFYYCISYSSCYCPSFNLSLCCLSPSVCLMSLFKSQYVACWNFTLTWPRQCQVLCSQWLALLNYIMYLWYLKLAANLVSWLLSLLLLFFWRNLCLIWTFLMGFCTICSRRNGSMPAATGLMQKTM